MSSKDAQTKKRARRSARVTPERRTGAIVLPTKDVRRELEKCAAQVRREAGLAPEDISPAPAIVSRVLGDEAYVEVEDFSTSAALAERDDNEFLIFVRRGEADANYLCAHEMGHWILRRIGFHGPAADEERFASYLGAALVASPEATRRMHAQFGENLPRHAAMFMATQSMMHIRFAEVFDDDRALVAPDHVRVPNPGRIPDCPRTLREWARGAAPRGIVHTRLRGGYDDGRVALRAC